MRRVELVSGLPHRPARGLTDKISPSPTMLPREALWAAEQARLYATLENLRAGPPRPAMAERDPNALPLRRAGAAGASPLRSAGANGRRGSARPSSPVAVAPRRRRGAHRRLDRPAGLYAAGAGLPVPPHRRRRDAAGQRAGGKQAHRPRRLARAGRGDARQRGAASPRSRRRRKARRANRMRRSAATRRCSTATRRSRSARRRHHVLSADDRRGPPADDRARAAHREPERLLPARLSTSPTITA